MSRSRFVTPSIVRLPLSDGDWVDVRRELNTGEQRALFGKIARDMVPGETMKLDPEQVGYAKVMAYLLAWSLVDDAGQPVVMTPAAVNNLQPDSFREIREAIDAHEECVEKERVTEKNVRTGERTSKATSPLPSAVAGATSGSEN